MSEKKQEGSFNNMNIFNIANGAKKTQTENKPSIINKKDRTEKSKEKKENQPIQEQKEEDKKVDTIKQENNAYTYTDKLPKRETKSKRLNLLLYPSLHNDIERLAEMQAIKANELINRVLREYTERTECQEMIENHKKITKKNKL